MTNNGSQNDIEESLEKFPSYEMSTWPVSQCIELINMSINALIQIIESKKEDIDIKDYSEEWTHLASINALLSKLPEKLVDHLNARDTWRENEQFLSALRSKEMIDTMTKMLARMRRHSAYSESTCNGEIVEGITKLRELVVKNYGKQDEFAQIISNRIIPFYSLHMVNAIRRNAPMLPRSYRDNPDITSSE